ncbi:unnamed protein product [Rotaria sp. Silwood1]|nr:unnamed protein product [Rotaria sp. Silwood1]
MVVLWAQSSYIPLIMQNALDNNVVGPYYTWILSSRVSLNFFNETSHDNLIGMLLTEPAIDERRYNYALFASDATWTLIQSLQQLCASKMNRSSSWLSFDGSSLCYDSRFIQSDLFLDAVSTTEFLGVSVHIQFSVNATDRIIDLYYSAKNVQPSSNVWPDNSLTPPTGSTIFKGVHLRIGVIESVPFTIAQNVTDASGQSTMQYSDYVLDLIKLSQSKTGFIPTIKLA